MIRLLYKNLLFSRYLIYGDTLVLDLWEFICRYLPVASGTPPDLIDIGCGSGAFSLGAALRGYRAIGLSWDKANQAKAESRAKQLALDGLTEFPIGDARHLAKLSFGHARFDYALCMENAEHILNDKKLLSDIADLLKPGGVLIFSAPYRFYKAISDGDNGPFPLEETGWHVRRGYSKIEVRDLLECCSLHCEEIGFFSGFLSQKATWLLRVLSRKVGYKLAWILLLPLRPLVFLFDRFTLGLWPGYSITAVAIKSRFRVHD
ncbi:bifunctional 2-polyprenyl-6-hydroxyphenol methylase/3-demethylubiquinol 3-O-methyltransferase UbiG [Synechococcus sp. CBW1006]|uniref:class I SAM-dependent methyltransferase n=1 Tax=Synechococcus sp. CBW1006 TaxID=1353138 RepID=UPI0018CF0A8F|nr:class I SAM-dependent methyltransferase [Synechococcus sp. CBW1006]QPN65936.1 methyltransferase domain-containing protein [Synechococcus sp. CBW1006]